MSTLEGPPCVMTVLLLDTYSLFFRAFHALPPMSTSKGEPTSALYGFSSLWLRLLREQRPAGHAFALDTPEPTFRHHAFAPYKAQREAIPSLLAQQLRRLDELIAAMQVPLFRAPGFEADDVLATLAQELASAGEQVLIVSGDRDLLQLVSPQVEVLFVGKRGKPAERYDELAVQRRFGLSPDKLPSYVALIGDPSDNLPGLAGIGPVTAQRLIASYGNIDTLLAKLDELTNRRAREQLAAHADALRLHERLARLRTDVPLGDGPRALPLSEQAIASVRALFEELEFRSLIPRLSTL